MSGVKLVLTASGGRVRIERRTQQDDGTVYLSALLADSFTMEWDDGEVLVSVGDVDAPCSPWQDMDTPVTRNAANVQVVDVPGNAVL